MDYWLVALLSGVVLAGAVSLIRGLIGRNKPGVRAAKRRHAASVAEREREIARIVAAWGADDHASLSPRERAVRALAECWALWSHVPAPATAAIRAAADALSLGVDAPSLRELAGLPERYADLSEVRDLLGETLDELEIVAVSPDSEEGQLLALRHYCLEWREGRLRDEQLAGWAHITIGHDGPLVAQELVELEDSFVTISSAHREVAQTVERFLVHVANLKPIRD